MVCLTSQVNVVRINNNIRILRRKLRLLALEKLGGKCVRCGFNDERALQFDHVNGGGTKDIRDANGGREYYKRILNDMTGKYQILCANCNWIKRAERHEYK